MSASTSPAQAPALWPPETTDLDWCPEMARRCQYVLMDEPVQEAATQKALADCLVDHLRRSGQDRIVDLCGGAGGAWRSLLPRMREQCPEAQVLVTDLHPAAPGAQAQTPGLTCATTPVDACDSARLPPGACVMIRSFHHLPFAVRRTLLAACARTGRDLLVIEATIPSLRQWAGVLLFSLPLSLRAAWRHRRAWWGMRWRDRLLLPLMPLAFLYDGAVSTWRTWSPATMRRVCGEIRQPGYAWEVRVVRASRWSPDILLIRGGQSAGG
jgi:hypothetical protein